MSKQTGYGFLEKQSARCSLDHSLHAVLFSIDPGRMSPPAHAPLPPGSISTTAAILLPHAYLLNPL